MFGRLLDDTVQPVHVFGENNDISKTFTYLVSVIHNYGGSCQEVLQRTALAHGVMESHNTIMST